MTAARGGSHRPFKMAIPHLDQEEDMSRTTSLSPYYVRSSIGAQCFHLCKQLCNFAHKMDLAAAAAGRGACPFRTRHMLPVT